MSAPTGWESVPERGALLGMRFVAWFYRRFGKRAAARLLVPVAAYCWATDQSGRRASRRYLARVYAQSAGRTALRHPPGPRASLVHYYQGALTVLDRAAFALGAGGHTRISFEGHHHFAKLRAEKRGALLLGTHLGSFDALRVLDSVAAGGPARPEILMETIVASSLAGDSARSAAALAELSEVPQAASFLERPPGLVIVYGDVNSTLAAALVCAKMLIPVAHVEAGLRSFDATMPEEINRRVTDELADPLFVTAPEGITNLEAEGIGGERVIFVGKPMIDTLLGHLERLDPAPVRARLGLDGRYAVATLHRPANVDHPDAARSLVAALSEATRRLPVVLPLHPRGRDMLARAGLGAVRDLRVIDPLGYLDFLSLVRGAAAVITDSGGIQEETTVLDVPCLTLRPNTERPITLTAGTNRLVPPAQLGPALDDALAGALRRPGGIAAGHRTDGT